MSSPTKISQIGKQEIVNYALNEISKDNHPYHNLKHTQEVIKRVLQLGNYAQLSENELYLLEIAAAFHDFGHSAYQYRQSAKDCNRNDLSNEEYAVLCADSYLKKYLSIGERILVQNMILATSYAQNIKKSLPPGLVYQLFRSYEAETKLEKILVFADISNFINGFDIFIEDNFNILLEQGREKCPDNFDIFIANALKFLEYVNNKLTEVSSFWDENTHRKLSKKLILVTQKTSELLHNSCSNSVKEKFNTISKSLRAK